MQRTALSPVHVSVSCEASVDVVDLLTSSSSFSFSVYSTLLYLFPGHTVLLIEATGKRTRQTGEGKSVQVLSFQLILFEGERERRRTNTDFLSFLLNRSNLAESPVSWLVHLIVSLRMMPLSSRGRHAKSCPHVCVCARIHRSLHCKAKVCLGSEIRWWWWCHCGCVTMTWCTALYCHHRRDMSSYSK